MGILTESDVIQQFRAAIERAGLIPPEEIIGDGRIHRFSSNGKAGDTAGWYVLHADGIPAGRFGCWRQGIQEGFRADIGRRLTTSEEVAYRARNERIRETHRVEVEKTYAAAAERAVKVWAAADAANDSHAYLERKQVGAHRARVDNAGRLLVPVMQDAKMTSLQFIHEDGTKRFLPGGRVNGGYFALCNKAQVAEAGKLVLCEGFATGATISEATDLPVVVAFNAANLAPVARTMREKFPDAEILIAADDDAGTPGNPGRKAANQAAIEVGGVIALPNFGRGRPDDASDFNDLCQLRGADAVRACIARPSPPIPFGHVEEPAGRTVVEEESDPSGIDAPAEASTANQADELGISDDELASVFSRQYADDLRYVAQWGKWLSWDGSRWAVEEKLAHFDLARRVARFVADKHVERTPDERAVRNLRKRICSGNTIAAIVRLAGADPRHAVAPNDLDADPWLLNTPGGVVDLRIGTTRAHDRHALHTKITAAAPGGDASTWLKFLERVLPDPEVRSYLQRLVGYGLTGLSREHVLPFFYGTGRNGKGTFVHTIRSAMGDYGLEIPAETLMESHHDRHLTEIAVLRGARFVIGSEVDTGRRWNESRMKRLTGGDPISARFIGRDLFEFEPSHTLVIVGNHKPGLRTVDEAIRARMHLVPFSVTIPAEERDPKLPERLQGELGGVLAWAIQGCLQWQEIGLVPPAAVLDATEEYLSAEDSLTQWVGEACNANGQVTLKDAHRSYVEWCEENRQPALGRNTFADQLRDRGYAVERDRGSNVVTIAKLELKSQRNHWSGAPD